MITKKREITEQPQPTSTKLLQMKPPTGARPMTGKPARVISDDALIKRINRRAKRPAWQDELPEENIFGGDNGIVLKMQGELKNRAGILCRQRPDPKMQTIKRVAKPVYLLLNFHDMGFSFLDSPTLEKLARKLGVLAPE